MPKLHAAILNQGRLRRRLPSRISWNGETLGSSVICRHKELNMILNSEHLTEEERNAKINVGSAKRDER